MQLMEYLPLYFQNIREFEAMMDAEQPEIDDLQTALDAVMNNAFVATLDESGCERWESMLGITPSAVSTLDDRRFAIQTQVSESLPYTWNALAARLDSLVGSENYTMVEKRADYTLVVRIAKDQKAQYNAAVKMLEALVPCNIILDISLLYTTYESWNESTYEELEVKTYNELRGEE